MIIPNRFPQVLAVCLLFPLLNSFAPNNSATTSIESALLKENTIFDNATNFENHETFFAALKAAELDQLLDTEGPFTVFIPSDRAFDQISSEKLYALMDAEDKMQLKSLLKYHIIKGEVSASKILKELCRGGGRTTLTTVQGTKIRVSFKGNDILLTDNLGGTAKITVADLEQSNGVVHQINRVIMPSRI